MLDFESYLKETGEVGYVQSIISSIFYVSGLPNARINELVLTENGLVGVVKAVLPEVVEVMIFEGHALAHNMKVVRTNQAFSVPVSEGLLGRIVDPFGIPQDTLGVIPGEKVSQVIEPEAPGINVRVRINRPLETGVMAVDMGFPVGMGQRELVLGDQKTGRTTFVLQTMTNQAKLGTICIYVYIGRKKSNLKLVESYLREKGVFSRVVIVVASSSDPAPMVYLAPFSGLAIAEYFRDRGNDVLVIFDDLTTHAKFYRELSLLSKRPPGRQSYPGDIFHLHARLTERAGNIKLADGKVKSITLLPVGDTLEGDLTGYIQTNLMAMTDGHLFFDVAEAKKGRHPALSFTLSVSRVGNQTRTPLERELAEAVTKRLSDYRKAEELGRFGIELTPQTMEIIRTNEKLEALFNQESSEVIPKVVQLIYLGLFFAGIWTEKSVKEVVSEKKQILVDFDAGKLDTMTLKIQKSQTLAELVGQVRANLKSLLPVAFAAAQAQTIQNPSNQAAEGAAANVPKASSTPTASTM